MSGYSPQQKTALDVWVGEKTDEQLTPENEAPSVLSFANSVIANPHLVDGAPPVLLGMVAARMYKAGWGDVDDYSDLGEVIQHYINEAMGIG